MTSDIRANLASVRQQIQQFSATYGRPENSVKLLAVSKTFPAQDIRQAFDSGQRLFGENYVDEALQKINALSDLEIEWHYIGPIQSNKTRKIAEHFDWVHSLASIKHARRLNNQRPAELQPLNVCIQINISGEDSKSGITTADINELARELQDLPRLRLRGIMGIPEKLSDLHEQRRVFSRLAALYRQLQNNHQHIDTLSMGMTADMEAAIAEGSTMVRIGTAIFGLRQPIGTDRQN